MGMLGDYVNGWLPEDPEKNAAARAGLLSFGAEMLKGRGNNFGGILGSGLQAGAGGYQGAIQQQQQAALHAEQQKRWKLENQESQAKLDEPMQLASILSGGQPGAGPAQQGTPVGAISGMPTATGTAVPVQAPAAAQPAQPAPAANPANLYQTYMSYGDKLSLAGKTAAAKPYYELAEKLRPKLKEQAARTVDGKRVLVNVMDDGTTQTVDGYSPDLEKLSFQDTGATTDAVDPYTGEIKRSIKNTQSPDSVARVNADMRVQQAITERAKMGSGGGQGIAPEDIKAMAEQYLAGDKTVFNGLGRGAQGAETILALRGEIGRQLRAKGQGGADVAAKIAEYGGLVTGLRATGNISARVENAVEEATQLAPLALAASKDVERSGFLPFGKAQIMFNTQSNDPALAKFATANMGLVTAYASAMARGNKPTVSDMEHARHLLTEAGDQRSYEAKVAQMMQEMEAAKRAPRNVRDSLTGEISGRGGHGAPSAKVAPAPPAAGTVKGGYLFNGGNPADKNNWVKQ